jgi:hypothetical protein
MVRSPLRLELEPRQAVEISARQHPRATGEGPVYDAVRRIIDVFGEPIPPIYATGDLGSPFGQLSLSPGVAEWFMTGRIAGCNVAAAKS